MSDPLNMESLIRANLPFLNGLAIHYAQDPHTAEDLLQETCLRIWKYQEKYAAGTNFRAWASVIMRNLFINDYRKQKVLREARERLKKQKPFVDSQVVSNDGELRLDYEAVSCSIHQLKENFSRPLLLFEAGLSYQEIAESMQTSLGTVKSRIHTARCYLKKWMAAA